MAFRTPARTEPAQEPGISPAVAAQVREAVSGLPSEEGDGAEGIVERLLSAQTMDDLNAPWDGSSTDALVGRTLIIRSVARRQSQFEDGAGVFIVARGADAGTGEQVTMTTSALSVVLQLAVCHQRGMLPVTAEVIRADKPTERGYYPIHLRILAVSAAGSAGDDGPGF